jgi:uncharacterized repeat protein (TIGR01451 family)
LGPADGAVTLNGDGSFVYVPAPDFHGTDTFQYRVCDSGADGTPGTGDDACSAPAVVSVEVAAINDPPLAVNDAASTNQATPVTVQVLANDSDIDSALDPSTVTVVGGPANGTAVPDGGGGIVYTPAAGPFSGDSFTYSVRDAQGALSNTATVIITINPPVIHVIKDAGAGSATLGELVDFTIYVWNDGPGTAYGVTIADSLGSCFVFVGPDPSGSIGDLTAGEAWVGLATARVVSTGGCSGSNTASISSLNAAGDSDSVTITIVP